jgi:UDP-N-acetylglucosamine transferase subunit ALG13
VSVGTNRRLFNRLIEAVDTFFENSPDEVIIQTGYSSYHPKNCIFFDFCSHDEFMSYIKKSEFVICQAGFGVISMCMSLDKPMILVPRESKYGEADDKQCELAEYLASEHDSIICVRNVNKLPDSIKMIKSIKARYRYNCGIPELIGDFIKKEFS